MQKRKFVVDLATLLILNLLIKPIWTLIIEPKVQGQLGNISYGEYFVVFNFSLMLSILLDMGLSYFNNKNIAQHQHLLSKHLSKMFMLKLSMAVIYMIFCLVVGYGLLGFNLKLILILCLNSFFLSLILFLRSNLQALHIFKTDSYISVLDRIFMLIMLAGMLLGWIPLKITLWSFVWVQTIGYALTACIAFIVVWRNTHFFKIQWDWKFNILIIRKSLPYAVLVLLMACYNRLDSIMLERILGGDYGKQQSGIYAKSFRLLDAANQIAYLFSVQLLPLFSRMIKMKQSVVKLLQVSYGLLITPALIVSISTIFYASYFFDKIYTGDTEGYQVLALLMSGFTAISLTYIFGTLLTAGGHLKLLNRVALTGILINFGLNFWLIPQFQVMGTAVSSIITQFFTGLVQIYLCYKVFMFKINFSIIFSTIIFIFSLCGLAFWSLHWFSGTNMWMLNFTLLLIGAAMLAFITQMLKFSSLFKLLNKGYDKHAQH